MLTFLKNLNKNISQKKMNLKFLDDLYLCIYNVSIHRNFYQNWFINEYAIKKKAKISESQNH